ncbi:acyl carrier protein [Kitasatospora sp. NPDC059463]|uniref:acyl carrier protein n=1 Tax=unclassified Kitasatospora TaxID=2633591 RepID=UPI00367CB5AE
MADLTLAALQEIIDSAIPEWGTTLTPENADLPFEELGVDSLALIETADRLQERYAVPIPDAAVDDLRTPRLTLAFVNAALARQP